MSRLVVIFICGLTLLPMANFAESLGHLGDNVALSASLAWDSRYVSEGRDNLDGDGLAGATVELGWRGLTLGSWYASSPDNGYDELNLCASYAVEFGALEAALGYTYLDFPADDADDHEVGLGLALADLPGGFELGLDSYYSFEADGAFFEAAAARPVELGRLLSLTPSAVLGANAGYMAAGHDGLNNAALLLEASLPLKPGVSLTAYIGHNWAINSDSEKYADDESLKDFGFGGLALNPEL
jgi:hypothetical protein